MSDSFAENNFGCCISNETMDVTVYMWPTNTEFFKSSTCSATPMSWEGEGIWYLNRIVVHREYRRQGLGTQLLDNLKSALRRRGCRKLIVTPGGYDVPLEDQIKFYEACGFSVVGDYEKTGSEWYMVWKS